MGQQEIIEWLREQRKSGNHKYYTMKQIGESIGETAGHYRRAIVCLWNNNILEVKVEFRPLRQTFRIKEEYVQ